MTWPGGPPWSPGQATAATAWWAPGEPCVVHVPSSAVGTHGDLVAETAEMIGRPLRPAQRVAVDALNAYRPGGSPVCMEAAVIGPRQTTGKTSAVILPTVLTEILTSSAPDLAIWTAHRAFAAMQAFKDLKGIILSVPDVSSQVRKINEKDGEEAVIFHNGWELQFRTRVEGTGRSLSARIVVLDEWLYGTSGMVGDLFPTMASRISPRVLYGSSAPKARSAPLHDVMRRGRSGDPGICYVEYRAPGTLADAGCRAPKCMHHRGTPGCALDDSVLVDLANPGVASGDCSRIVVTQLRGSMTPVEYAREMLGWEEELPDTGTPIGAQAWQDRTDPGSGIVGPRWLGVDITPDRRAAAIGGAGHRGDGDTHLALVDHAAGTSWVVPRLVQMCADHDIVAVVVDSIGPAASLIPDLEAHGLKVRTSVEPDGKLVVATATDVGSGCAQLQDAIAGDAPWAWHRGDPALQDAVQTATSRPIGRGMWAFRPGDADISPLVAVTLALLGMTTVSEPDGDDDQILVAWGR